MDDGKQRDLRKGTNCLGKTARGIGQMSRNFLPYLAIPDSRFSVFRLQKLPATEGCSNGKANQEQCPCHQLIYNYAHQHGRPEVGQQKPFWRICSISQLRHETETETETQKCQRFRLVCLLGDTLRKYSKQKLKQ